MRLKDYAKEERERVAAINGFLAFAFDVLTVEQGHCLKTVSNMTGLCLATLRRLKKGETVTSNVRVGTLQKVEKAAGIVIGWPTGKSVFIPVDRVRKTSKKPAKTQRTLV